jgi:hypothetical protein
VLRGVWPPTIQQLNAQYNNDTERLMIRVLAASRYLHSSYWDRGAMDVYSWLRVSGASGQTLARAIGRWSHEMMVRAPMSRQ